MAKNLLLLVTYLCSLQTMAYSIIPNKTDQSLFYLYKYFTIDQTAKTVKVNGIKVTGMNGEGRATIQTLGNIQTISLEKFMFFRQYSPAIFAAVTGNGDARGSAFLIANDLVLTNKHVADTDNVKKSCGQFSITMNDIDEQIVTCKKVWYCDTHDFCLIELNKTKSQKSVGELVKPLVFANQKSISSNSEVNSISNVRGLGIQAGTGHGIKYVNLEDQYGSYLPASLQSRIHQMEHYAPTLPGSSGSPILNNNGLVMAINYAESGGEYGNDGINYGVPSYYILNQLKANLPASLFAQIKTAAPTALTEGDRTFEKLWMASWEKYSSLSVYDDQVLLQCLNDNRLAECLVQFNKIRDDAQKMMKGLTKEEQNLILVHALDQIRVVTEIQKIISISGSFELRPHQENCQAYKDLSFDCVKEEFITTVLFKNMFLNKWLMDFDAAKKESFIQAIISRSELTDRYYKSMALAKLESNKDLMGKIFVKCLNAVKTISSADEGWLGDYSDIGFDDRCKAVILPTVKAAGYNLKDYEEDEVVSSMRFGMSRFQFSESFRKSVVKKWEYFIQHLLTNRNERQDSNITLIENWLKEEKVAEEKSLEIFKSIQNKMRLL